MKRPRCASYIPRNKIRTDAGILILFWYSLITQGGVATLEEFVLSQPEEVPSPIQVEFVLFWSVGVVALLTQVAFEAVCAV